MSIGHEEDYDDIYDEYTEEPGDSEYRNSTSGTHESDEASTAAKAVEVQPKTLSSQFIALIAAMQTALWGLPENLVAAICNLPSVGTLPLPRTTWLFLSIVARLQRERWGRALIEECMPEVVPPCDGFSGRDQLVERQLPGHPEWKMQIDCEARFASLCHQESREVIFVDIFEDGDGALLPLEDWNAHLRRDQEVDPASGRLLQLNPLRRGLDLSEYWGTYEHQRFDCDWFAVEELEDNGLVLGRMYGKYGPAPDDLQPDYFVAAEFTLRQEELVLKFLNSWKDPAKQLWCSASVGDWPRTHELAVETGDEKLIRVAANRAEQCRQDQIRRLIKSAGDGPAPFYVLRGLYDLQAPELDEYIQRGLDGERWAQQAVIELLDFTADPRWCQ